MIRTGAAVTRGAADMALQLRQLEQMVRLLKADIAVLLAERAVTQQQIKSLLQSVAGLRRTRMRALDSRTPPEQSLTEICDKVAAAFEVPVLAIRHRSRSVQLGRARYAFCEAAVTAGYAHAEIADFMGNRPASLVDNILCRGRRAAG